MCVAREQTREGLSFLYIFNGQKSETTVAHKNKMQKYPVDKTCQNVSGLLLLLKIWMETDTISGGPK